jgi:acetyl-CoA synthetase
MLKSGELGSDLLAQEPRAHVATKLGKFTMIKQFSFVQELPKTRSGKVMRRLLRDIADGRMLGDTTTLADSSIVAELQDRARAEAPKEQ